tara:strand:- start:4371 stop:4703 length:333 start_codon:yes stop_codon:yes gene_type:complete
MPDSPGAYTRGQTLEVSQDWLNQWRNYLPLEQFRIEGDEGVSIDDGDGLPDKGWNRKNIMAWLKEKGVETGTSYLTKSAALALVERTLNPPSPEITEDVIDDAEEAVTTE